MYVGHAGAINALLIECMFGTFGDNMSFTQSCSVSPVLGVCVCVCVCARARACVSSECLFFFRKAPIGVGHALSCLTIQLTRIGTLGTRVVPVCVAVTCVCTGGGGLAQGLGIRS